MTPREAALDLQKDPPLPDVRLSLHEVSLACLSCLSSSVSAYSNIGSLDMPGRRQSKDNLGYKNECRDKRCPHHGRSNTERQHHRDEQRLSDPSVRNPKARAMHSDTTLCCIPPHRENAGAEAGSWIW